MDAAIDKAEKAANTLPSYLTKDWVLKLTLLKLRYAHLTKLLRRDALKKEVSAWMLGEELMAVLLHMKHSRSSPTAIHQAIWAAKEEQQQERLFKSSKKQAKTWKKVTTTVENSLRRDGGTKTIPTKPFQKNDSRPTHQRGGPERAGRDQPKKATGAQHN